MTAVEEQDLSVVGESGREFFFLPKMIWAGMTGASRMRYDEIN
jgi:hypothetical protein